MIRSYGCVSNTMRLACIKRSRTLVIVVITFIFLWVIFLFRETPIEHMHADNALENTTNFQNKEQEKVDLEYLILLVRRSFSKSADPKYSEFNETLSHSISLKRSIQDHRHKMCLDRVWRIKPALRVSVIIPFVNEPWSTLFRTIVSILLRSPLEYIEELVLVDDHSDRDFLQDTLHQVLSPFSYLMRLVRTPIRMGPAATRNYGARHSKGNVLVFLDSHCEVNAGWLEPLLEAISQDHSRIVMPSLDVISGDTLRPRGSHDGIRVQMTWSLGASYGFYPPHIWGKYNITDPIPQISLLGAVFVVDTKFFFKMGGMGDYFWGWGGEDVELALKYWLCGGGVVRCRCSRVAHVFKSHPYRITTNPLENVALLAEAWLEEYISIFKCVNFKAKASDKSVLKTTFALKKNLKCRSFKWYLDNIFPELEVPEPNTTFIKPHLVSEGKYFIATQDKMTPKFGHIDEPSVCSVAIVNDRIKCKGMCLTASGSKLIFETCSKHSKSQMWTYINKRLQSHANKTLCIGIDVDSKTGLVNCEVGKTQISFESEFLPNCINAVA